MGAQFVACLDLQAEGGLVGELRIGASALFARVEQGRFVLLRTPIIERVEYRTEDDALRDESTEVLGPAQNPAPPWPPAAPPPRLPHISLDDAHTPEPPTPTVRFPAHVPGYDPAYATPLDGHRPGLPSEEELDIEDFLSISVSEVARTSPLYRPPPGAPPPAPWPYARAPLPPPRPPPRPPSAAPPAAARPPAPPAAAPARPPTGPLPPPRPPSPGVVDPGRRLR